MRPLHAAAIRSIDWRMDWTTPSFEEIKMDAEIGSYQADEPERDPLFTSAPPAASASSAFHAREGLSRDARPAPPSGA